MWGGAFQCSRNVQQPKVYHKMSEVLPKNLLLCPFSYFCHTLLFPKTQHNEPGIQESFVDTRGSISAVGVSQDLDMNYTDHVYGVFC